MTNLQLQNILGNNVVELTFERRHPKLGWSNIRGLLGTTNYPLLNGEFGHNVLRFSPPIGVGMGYDYKSKNLCVVWDIFRQEYRVFGAEQVNIRQQFPLSSPEEVEQFTNYFYENIINMSNQQKIDFMGYVGSSLIGAQLKQMNQQKNDSISKRLQGYYTNFRDRVSNFFKNR